jgi:hypothetical protein
VQAPADPQTLNRYAYTRNNPLKYVDPSGHCFLFAGLDTLACLGAWMMVAGGLGLAGVASYQLMPDQIKADAGRAIDALVTDLTRGPEAIHNTAGAGPQIDASPALGYPLGPAQGAGTGGGYPLAGESGALRLTTPLQGSATVQLGGPLMADAIPTINVSKKLYGQAAKHIEDAQNAGQPEIVTIDRSNAPQRRTEAMSKLPPLPFLERDEYPPAMFKEGGANASVRYVNPRDNRACGAYIGNACRPYPDGTRVRIKVVEE